MKICDFLRFCCFFAKMKKRRKPLILLGFSGVVFGVPEVIRTPDLPLRSSLWRLVYSGSIIP